MLFAFCSWPLCRGPTPPRCDCNKIIRRNPLRHEFRPLGPPAAGTDAISASHLRRRCSDSLGPAGPSSNSPRRANGVIGHRGRGPNPPADGNTCLLGQLRQLSRSPWPPLKTAQKLPFNNLFSFNLFSSPFYSFQPRVRLAGAVGCSVPSSLHPSLPVRRFPWN